VRMPRRNYSTAKWQTRFKNLAKAGGKGAHKTLDRPAYSAFWRRFPRSAWKLENKRKKRGRKRNMKRRKGRRTRVTETTATPSWKQLYAFTEINTILQKAQAMVRANLKKWAPVSRNPNHIQARAREAFDEAAYQEAINPSHLKARLPKRYAVSNTWFAQVVNQSFMSKGNPKPMGKNMKKDMKRLYNELKAVVEEAERHWLELSYIECA
jgi:hypothetical protein